MAFSDRKYGLHEKIIWKKQQQTRKTMIYQWKWRFFWKITESYPRQILLLMSHESWPIWFLFWWSHHFWLDFQGTVPTRSYFIVLRHTKRGLSSTLSEFFITVEKITYYLQTPRSKKIFLFSSPKSWKRDIFRLIRKSKITISKEWRIVGTNQMAQFRRMCHIT